MRRSDGPVIINGEMFFFFIWKMKTRQVMVDIYQFLFFLSLFLPFFFFFSLPCLCTWWMTPTVVLFFLPQICVLYFVRKDTGRETLGIVSVLVFPLHWLQYHILVYIVYSILDERSCDVKVLDAPPSIETLPSTWTSPLFPISISQEPQNSMNPSLPSWFQTFHVGHSIHQTMQVW